MTQERDAVMLYQFQTPQKANEVRRADTARAEAIRSETAPFTTLMVYASAFIVRTKLVIGDSWLIYKVAF